MIRLANMNTVNVIAVMSSVLLCAAWLQPIFLPPWVAFHGEVFAFAALATVLLVLIGKLKSGSGILFSFPEMSLCVLLMLIYFQYSTGKIFFLGDAVVYTIYIVGFMLVIAAVRANFFEINIQKYLAWCIVVSGGMSAFIALLQTLFVDLQSNFIVSAPSWRRPGANLAQANNLGTLLLWAQASVFYLYTSAKLKNIYALILMGALAIGLAITESRTALIGVIALSFWIYAALSQMSKKTRLLFCFIYFLASLGLFLFWPKLMEIFYEGGWGGPRLDSRIDIVQSGARGVVWGQLIEAISMQPIFGWGFGGVPHALNGVIDKYRVSYPFTYAHNIIFDLAVGVGLPVMCVFLISWMVWISRRISWKVSSDRWYSFALLIPFLLHSLTEFPFSYAYFLFPVGAAIGVIGVGQAGTLSLNISRALFFVFYLIWCLVVILVFRDYVLAEEDFRVARMEARKIGKISDDYIPPKMFFLDQLDAINKATRLTPTPNMSVGDIKIIEAAALKYPWTAIQSRYALVLALNGNAAEAKRQLIVMRVMHGQEVYDGMLEYWRALAKERYPQLEEFI